MTALLIIWAYGVFATLLYEWVILNDCDCPSAEEFALAILWPLVCCFNLAHGVKKLFERKLSEW